eukprot:gene5252-7298_t
MAASPITSENVVRSGAITDEHRYPFALVSEFKHNRAGSHSIYRTGDVTEMMDKLIGRPIFRIKGAVSANNYIEFDHLHLSGPFLYIQISLMKPTVATMHIEVLTSANMTLRLTLSTLYVGDKPRFLGRSLRLPLPLNTNWMTLAIDLNRIVSSYCTVASPSIHQPALTIIAVKKIQICSNMLFREVVSSDQLYNPFSKLLPKELTTKPGAEADMHWVDLFSYCTTISSPQETSKTKHSIQIPMAARITHNVSDINKSNNDSSESNISKTNHTDVLLNSSHVVSEISFRSNPLGSNNESIDKSKSNISLHQFKENYKNLISPVSPTAFEHNNQTGKEKLNLQSSLMSSLAHSHNGTHHLSFREENAIADMSSQNENGDRGQKLKQTKPNIQTIRIAGEEKSTILSKALTTPRNSIITVPTAPIVKFEIPEVNAADKVLALERMLGYSGGPAVVIDGGRLLITSSGPIIVLVDLEKHNAIRDMNLSSISAGSNDISSYTGNHDQISSQNHGLWRAFKPIFINSSGYRQSFLKSHKNNVSIIEISSKETFMVTCESTPNGIINCWDLVYGRKVFSLKPYVEGLISVGFNTDASLLVTAGLDQQRRFLIVIWDIQLLLQEKAIVIGTGNSSANVIIAKQISEFPIYQIKFSPFEDFTLLSCGRENIRFWRVRKGHLPGRPVLLNEYSRGFLFKDIAFSNDVFVEGGKNFAYVSSNKGLLIKINCQNDQVVCAYQLHSGSIESLCVRGGYAVTGADDHKLRIWPLDFSDFLLESQHEGVVTNIRVSVDGKQQVIGTAAGTLGMLSVSDHSYCTILRSHIGSITRIAKRGTDGSEFATIGVDNTIRLWDIVSATQVIEFTSDKDEPKCISYHLTNPYIACGFNSGYVRIFNIQTATATYQKKKHVGSVLDIQYFNPTKSTNIQLLISIGLDCAAHIYDCNSNYEVLKTITISHIPIYSVCLSINSDSSLIAIGFDKVSSVIVFETQEFNLVLKLNPNIAKNSPLPSKPVQSASIPSPSEMFLSPDSNAQSYNVSIPEERATPIPTNSSLKSPISSTISSSLTLNSPLVGLCFDSEHSSDRILLLTNKHFVSIPISFDKTTNRGFQTPMLAWEHRSIKRIDFGTPTGLIQDQQTGLIFLSMTLPQNLTKKIKRSQSVLRTVTVNVPSQSPSVASNRSISSKSRNKSFAASPMQMQMSSPSTSSFGGNGGKGTHALVVLDVKYRMSDSRLSMSKPQVYYEHSVSINHICPCLSFNKVISVDAIGSIAMWEFKRSKIEKVLVDLSQQSPFDNTNNKYYMDPPNSPTTIIARINNYIADEENITPMRSSKELTRDFELAVQDDPALWSAESNSKKLLLKNIDNVVESHTSENGNKFDIVLDDGDSTPREEEYPQSLESFQSTPFKMIQEEKSKLIEKMNHSKIINQDTVNSQKDDNVRVSFESMFDDEDLNPLNAQSPLVMKISNNNSSPIKAIDEPLVPNSAVNPVELSINTSAYNNTTQNDSYKQEAAQENHAISVSDMKDWDRHVKYLNKFQQNINKWSQTVSNAKNDIYSISTVITVPPSFCRRKDMMLLSNSSTILIKHVRKKIHRFLPFPQQFNNLDAKIVRGSFSPSGSFVSAIIELKTSVEKSNDSSMITILHVYYLLVWIRQDNGDISQDAIPDWLLVDCVEILTIPQDNHNNTTFYSNQVFIDWTLADTLVIANLIPSENRSSQNYLQHTNSSLLHRTGSIMMYDIRIATINTDILLSGKLNKYWRKCNHRLPSSFLNISGMKMVPTYVKDDVEPSLEPLHIVLFGESKIILVELPALINDKSMVPILWTHDVGTHGPIVSMDISKIHIKPFINISNSPSFVSDEDINENVLIALDSDSNVHITHFSALQIPRTFTVKIPAANASGSLRGITILRAWDSDASSSSSPIIAKRNHDSHRVQTALAVYSNVDIRLYSINIKEINNKSISVTLPLFKKILLDFVPDFVVGIACSSSFWSTPHRHGSGFNLLAANGLGNIGFIPATDSSNLRIGLGECLTIQSQVIPSTLTHAMISSSSSSSNGSSFQIMSAVGEDSQELIVLLVKGQVYISLISNGIKLPFPGFVGMTYATCMTTLGDKNILAFGSENGRISLFDLQTMQQLMIITIDKNDNKNNSSDRDASQHQVTHLHSLYHGKLMLCVLSSYEVFILSNEISKKSFLKNNINKKLPIHQSLSYRHTKLSFPSCISQQIMSDDANTSHTTIPGMIKPVIPVQCDYSGDSVWGIIRNGNILELYTASDPSTRDNNNVKNITNILLNPSIDQFDSTTFTNHNNNNLRISHCHCMLYNRIILIVNYIAYYADNQRYLITGSIRLPYDPTGIHNISTDIISSFSASIIELDLQQIRLLKLSDNHDNMILPIQLPVQLNGIDFASGRAVLLLSYNTIIVIDLMKAYISNCHLSDLIIKSLLWNDIMIGNGVKIDDLHHKIDINNHHNKKQFASIGWMNVQQHFSTSSPTSSIRSCLYSGVVSCGGGGLDAIIHSINRLIHLTDLPDESFVMTQIDFSNAKCNTLILMN